MKKDLESSEGEKSQKIKELEKLQRQWKQEKDELLRVRRRVIFGSRVFHRDKLGALNNRIWPTRKKSCGFNRKS